VAIAIIPYAFAEATGGLGGQDRLAAQLRRAAPGCLPTGGVPVGRRHQPARLVDANEQGARIASNPRAPALPGAIHRVRRALAIARAEDVFLYSAALAFYGLISVAPLVVVALWVTSLVVGPTQIHDAAAELARFSPEGLGVDGALERVADLGTRLGLVAVIAAVWPATAYGSALVRVLDRLTGDRDATGLRRRGAALLLVCLAPVLVLASLVASYAGATTLGNTTGEIAVGLTVALVYGFGATFVTVGFIYRVLPRTLLDWRSTIHGALIAAASISVLSVTYVAYLRLGANFERRYAWHALAAVVLLGLWLFAANTALLVGYRAAHRRGPAVRIHAIQEPSPASSAAESKP
jgi:membrane protein